MEWGVIGVRLLGVLVRGLVVLANFMGFRFGLRWVCFHSLEVDHQLFRVNFWILIDYCSFLYLIFLPLSNIQVSSYSQFSIYR
jgi:hypothetical protein